MSDKSYDGMTHDEILREHAARYAQMTPKEKAQLVAERKREALEMAAFQNRKMSEVTMGELTSAVEEAMRNVIVPELQAIVSALGDIKNKLG